MSKCASRAPVLLGSHPPDSISLRVAILRIGGERTGDDRWYEVDVPIADRLYDRHLDELKKEGTMEDTKDG